MKRGMGHIEMVLSFIIFIGAIILALYFFRPTDSSRIVQTSFDYLFREIEKNASNEVVVFGVKVNGNLISSESVIGFDISAEDNALVVDEFGNVLKTKTENGVVFAERNSWNDVEFVNIFISENFDNDLSILGVHNSNYYEIGSSTKKEIISEEKMDSLKEFYNSNYSEVKKMFNIPGRVNFDFSLKLSDREIEAIREIPDNLEVFVSEEDIEVLRSESIERGVLTIRVW